MRVSIINVVLILSCITSNVTFGAIIIPQDASTIQEGINMAQNNDTVLISDGLYYENIQINSKKIVVASFFIFDNDTSHINNTIINGLENSYVFRLNSLADSTIISGLTIINSNDGLTLYSRATISNCIIYNCKDGLDYESGSGGILSNCLIYNNHDDAVDLDGSIDIIIQNNIIINNNDDGIEIRLHPYLGDVLNIIIISNIIAGNQEDGIQFIDYDDSTSRKYRIEKNLIYNNSMVGIGCMGNANSNENYEGAPISEEILVINNTFSNNPYHITGGSNLLSLNNIFYRADSVGVKNVTQNSLVDYCNFAENNVNAINSNVDTINTIYTNPLLDSLFNLMPESPCINAAAALYIWNEDTILNLSSSEFYGFFPDIGANEYDCSIPDLFDTLEICQNDSVFLGNAWQKEPGQYSDTLLNNYGCDSIINTNLIVHLPYYYFDTLEICQNDSVFLGNEWRKEPGQYSDSLLNIYGCDSIIITDLYVHPSFYCKENSIICNGDSIYWQGAYYFTTGEYYGYYQTINGCDSIFELDLFVYPTPEIFSIDGQDTVEVNQVEHYFAPENQEVTYYWNVENGIIIENNSNDSIRVKWLSIGTGNVTAVANNQYGCTSDTASLEIVIGTTNVSNHMHYESIIIYPNPANDKIYLKWKKELQISSFDIIDSQGGIVRIIDVPKGRNKVEIDIHELKIGPYVILINKRYSTLFLKH